MTNRVSVLGCMFDRVTLADTVKMCLTWISEDPRPRFLVGMNANNIVLMRKDSKYRQAVAAAELVQADGVSVVVASCLLGVGLPGRVNGTDLMIRLIEEANRYGLRIFFLGSREVVLRKVIEKISREYPRIAVAGWQNGYFKEDDEARIIGNIRRSQADILFIGMPTPFKEIWAFSHLGGLNVTVVHGVGGSFDVFAGFVPRAPVLMQRLGLEWVWRLIMEPRKMWKRYLLGNTVFLCMLLKELFAKYATDNLFGQRKRARCGR